MPLTEGTRLGSYEILSPLGAGGMGEVYRARDTKLGREVAIKVLPEDLASDRERLARFEREAKLLAGLNHANIATLHGIEGVGEKQFLVMELVEGETLSERIARGPIPMDEAIPIFTQIAEGLGAAHDKGVVHRDLKPANVKITPDGHVKILDFGLAKAFDVDDARSEDTSQSPTLTKGTAMGVILGTAPYMSPEQARGKSVDKRTDIWAFGCCLYEALTGKRAFEGETVTDTLAAIVKNEPEWDRLPPGTPSSVRKLMQRCLRKDPSTRLRDPWDVRVLMEVDDDNVPAVTPKRPLVAPTLIAGALLGAIVVWATLGVGSTPDSRTTRLEIYLEEGGLQYVNTASVPLAISPDGSSLVYVTRVGSASQLFLRSLDTYDARAIPNTEGALAPFFSPDGHWIGFLGSDTVNKISLQGSGRLAVVSDDRVGAAASWGDDGHILYSGRAGLYSVSENGGEPIIVAKDEVYGFPERLPGGRGFLCTVVADGEARIGVISSRTGEWKVLDVLGEGTTPKYLPTGHIVYGSGGTILAAPFDISRAEITGVPTPVVTGVASRSNRLMGEYAFYAVSSSGHLAYVPGGISIQRRLVWVDRYGRESPLRTEAGPYEYPAVSPDGSRIAYTRHDSDHDSWLYHLERLTETRLTNEGGSGNVWTPDGQRITLGFGTEYDIYLQDTEARGEAELLIPRANSLRPGIWSPDGLDLIYVAADDAGNRDIWVRRANGETSRLVDSRFDEYQPALSPDGRLIAYVSTQSGAEEVYVQPYPQLDRRWLISRGGGREPRWSPQGNELFYRLDRLVLAVTTRATPEFSASVPETLFEGDFHIEPGNMDNPDYDIHPDGERFLMIKNEEPHRRIRVVLNWFDELERLVPIL